MAARSPWSLVGAVLLCVVPVLGAWVALRPSSSPPRPEPVDRLSLERRLRAPPVARASIERVQPRPSHPVPALPPTRPELTFSPEWDAIRDDLSATIAERPAAPPPASTAAVDTYLTRTRERRNLLSVLELELLDFIEHEVNPYARLDAEVTLAELYVAKADLFDATWVPDHFTNARADRRVSRLETRAAVARDKALLVKGLAETEAAKLRGLPSDDGTVQRLKALEIP